MLDHQTLKKLAENESDPLILAAIQQYLNSPFLQFSPRPDNILLGDEQTAFCNSEFDGLSCILAGNGAGKSYCCGWKIANFLLNTEAPEWNTPFWICSKSMDMVTSNCWRQNLSQFIGDDYIQKIHWHNQARGQPRAVILKSPKNNMRNYMIEFKSYDMNRSSLQGANIIGFWCDEQCGMDILNEITARTRKWELGGTKFYTLTPLEPDIDLERIYNDKENYPSWKFFRFNSKCAADAGHITQSYIKQITENEIDELIETRITGAFASYKGQIYKNFNASVHIIDPIDLPRQWSRVAGLDFGFDDPTAAVFAAKNPDGTYYIYQEYMESRTTIEEHVDAINMIWKKDSAIYLDIWADQAAGVERNEFATRGLSTRAASKSVTTGIAAVSNMLRTNKLFIFKNCENLIQQLKLYRWNPTHPGKVMKQNDHLCDALRYLVFSEQKELKPWAAIPRVPFVNKAPY